jgi:hypothetical protein
VDGEMDLGKAIKMKEPCFYVANDNVVRENYKLMKIRGSDIEKNLSKKMCSLINWLCYEKHVKRPVEGEVLNEDQMVIIFNEYSNDDACEEEN